MRTRLKVLLASRSAPALKALGASFVNIPDVDCVAKLVSNGHSDPLHNVSPLPDVLLLRFDTEHLAELAALAGSDPAARPPLIVVGPAGSAEAVRLAIRAGAKDFLPEPLDSRELAGAIERIRTDLKRSAPAPAGDVTAVVGAAGGVGASFLACNLALSLAAERDSSVLLVDLDFTYAPLAGFFDLHPVRGLLEALGEVEALDEHALAGYVARHASGLRVIGAAGEAPALSREVDPSRLALLLNVLAAWHRHVILDVPRHLDGPGATALGMAKHVLVVVQQSVAQLRSAVRLTNVLTREIGIDRERIRIVVNRWQKRATVGLEDIQQALEAPTIAVPNHYAAALASIDSGIPLIQADVTSPVARAVQQLKESIGGAVPVARAGFLRRALPMFSRE